jgi:putative iron-regulated protein
MKTKIWVGLGTAIFAGTAAIDTFDDKHARPIASAFVPHAFAQGGEGGEGGGGPLGRYSIGATDAAAFQYESRPQIEAYVDLVRSSYAEAAKGTGELLAAVEAFLADPSQKTMDAARAAWTKARPAYLITEAYRFYDGPIEAVEGQINAWPMNEAAIDYVEGNPSAGIINSASFEINPQSLIAENQAKDEADVTTGWHAVEFLLWGQDLSAEGPGKRPVEDYVAGNAANDRRRQYLKIVTEQLHADVSALHDAWSTSDADAYSAKFLGLEPREAIGRMLNGIAILAGFEFMSERLAVALDSGDQEDEHSCFSDTTKQDFVYDLAGIKAVWTGDGAGKERPGLDEVLKKLDAGLAAEVDGLLAQAEADINALGDPWDQVLAAAPGSEVRVVAEKAVASLQALGEGFKRAGAKLGVLVLIPEG